MSMQDSYFKCRTAEIEQSESAEAACFGSECSPSIIEALDSIPTAESLNTLGHILEVDN